MNKAAGTQAGTPSALYAQGVADKRWEDDPAQRTVLVQLDRIQAELIAAEKTKWWQRLRATPPVRGLYLYGSVGRGKTFLVDLFFESLPFEAKLRRHFHRFMQEVHAELNRLKGHEDPLVAVAAHFAAEARVFCLDEFFVTDIGDAMILANLLKHLFARGVTLVTTSNIVPKELYKDGLQRERFLPAIELLEKNCEVVNLNAQQDYRLRALTQAGVYFTPLGDAAERHRRDEALALAHEALAACRAFNRRAVEIRVLMELARLHTTVPGGEASAADHAAALACLREAVTISKSIEGYQIGGDLYDALAREHAHAGDHAVAYEVSRQAAQAREATVSTAALNRSIAMQIGFQTERTRAEAELQRSLATTLQQTTAMLETLGAIGQEITRHLDEQAVFEILRAHVHELLDATHFSVWALAAEGDALELVFGIDQGQPMVPGRRIPMDREGSNIAHCARTREEILRREAPTGFNPHHIPGTIPSASALFAPLIVGDSLLGVMSIQSPKAHAYGERERLIFRTLCAYGAIGLHNSRAYKLLGATLGELQQARDELARKNELLEQAWLQQQEASFTDPLTQLRNRRFLMAHVEDEIALTLRRFERHQRQQSGDVATDHDLVFYMLDIDFFKSVNDQHGHAAGDAVLVETARRLRSVIRETDFLIRWGGEEFLLVARATHAGEASVLAERLRAVVDESPFDLGEGKSIGITCSIGFASFPFCASEPRLASWSEVTRLADQALYLSKEEGRNRWIGVEARSAPRDRTHFEQICREPRAAQAEGDVALLRSAAVSGSP